MKPKWIGPQWAVVASLMAATAFGQELVRLAEQEKLRRQQTEPRRVQIVVEAARETSGRAEAGKKQSDRSVGSRETLSPGKGKSDPDQVRIGFLRRRGPEVKETIRVTRLELAGKVQEIEEASRNRPPVWRQGRAIEDSGVVALRREVERLRKSLAALEREWQRMEEEARRNGWPPGVLRGQLP